MYLIASKCNPSTIMHYKLNILLVIASCLIVRALSITIKHTHDGERQLVELGPQIYAISKLGIASDQNYKALSRNEDRIAVYIDHCIWISSKYSELNEYELKYLNVHHESLSGPLPEGFNRPEIGSVTYIDSENVSIASLPGENPITSMVYKGFSIKVLLGTLTLSKLDGEMEMGLIRLIFTEDLVVFVYENNWVDMIPSKCVNEAQRVYLEELQEILGPRGIHYNINNCLYYDPTRVEPETPTEATVDNESRRMKYEEELQQLETEMSQEIVNLESDIQDEISKIDSLASTDSSSEKERLQERLRRANDEIINKYNHLRHELKAKFAQDEFSPTSS